MSDLSNVIDLDFWRDLKKVETPFWAAAHKCMEKYRAYVAAPKGEARQHAKQALWSALEDLVRASGLSKHESDYAFTMIEDPPEDSPEMSGLPDIDEGEEAFYLHMILSTVHKLSEAIKSKLLHAALGRADAKLKAGMEKVLTPEQLEELKNTSEAWRQLFEPFDPEGWIDTLESDDPAAA